MTTRRASIIDCDHPLCEEQLTEYGEGGQVRRAAVEAGWRRLVVSFDKGELAKPGDFCPKHVQLIELARTPGVRVKAGA